MARNKTAFLNMRVNPATKQALRAIAARENRSMADTVEWLVADYVAKHGLRVPKMGRSLAAVSNRRNETAP
jgi:hypothetical protein